MIKYSFKTYLEQNSVFDNFKYYDDDQLMYGYSDYLSEKGDLELSDFIKLYLGTPHFTGIKHIRLNNLEENYNKIEMFMRLYDNIGEKKHMNKILSIKDVFFNDIVFPKIKEIAKIFKTNYYDSCLIFKLTDYGNLFSENRPIDNADERLERINRIIRGNEVVDIYSYDEYEVIAQYIDRGNNRLKTVCWDGIEFSLTGAAEFIRNIHLYG